MFPFLADNQFFCKYFFVSSSRFCILIYGGLLQMEQYTYRNVKCISTPSVCATDKEMNTKRYANTVGAWYVTIKAKQRPRFPGSLRKRGLLFQKRKTRVRRGFAVICFSGRTLQAVQNIRFT